MGGKISGVGTWNTKFVRGRRGGDGERAGEERKGGGAFVDTKRAKRSPLTLTLNFSSFPLPSFNLISKSLRASNRVAPARVVQVETSLEKVDAGLRRGENEVWSWGQKRAFKLEISGIVGAEGEGTIPLNYA